MLEVHPPEHTPHTWRDFFIHIATIVVGLLIAVALEQTVETIHRHHQRETLRESLNHESEQMLRDCGRLEVAMTAEIKWHEQVDELLIAAARQNQTITQLPPEPALSWDIPDVPVFKAAKASNSLGLLTQQEAEAYGEVSSLIDHLFLSYDHREDALRSQLTVQRELRFSQPIPADAPRGSLNVHNERGFNSLVGLPLTGPQLKEIHQAVVRVEINSQELRYWSRQVRGAATVMQQGERDLHKIEAAESQFDNLP